MSKQAAEHHLKAAEHHDNAARHHRGLPGTMNPETTKPRRITPTPHKGIFITPAHHASEAAKSHLEHHGAKSKAVGR